MPKRSADILSDDTIAEMLQKEQGIDVARRTVAKYREGMNIPSSVIRRRQKRALMRGALRASPCDRSRSCCRSPSHIEPASCACALPLGAAGQV